jgi:hypothetical protein
MLTDSFSVRFPKPLALRAFGGLHLPLRNISDVRHISGLFA